MKENLSIMNEACIKTPIGLLQLRAQENKLLGIDFPTQQAAGACSQLNPFLQFVATQLQSYFNFPGQIFSLPLSIQGTPFQKRVWALLQAIPPGQTRTYSELATQLNSHPRAIGNACRCNPFLIVIPCHRVIAKTGIGGFSGEREGHFLNKKSWLLEHESSLNSPSSY